MNDNSQLLGIFGLTLFSTKLLIWPSLSFETRITDVLFQTKHASDHDKLSKEFFLCLKQRKGMGTVERFLYSRIRSTNCSNTIWKKIAHLKYKQLRIVLLLNFYLFIFELPSINKSKIWGRYVKKLNILQRNFRNILSIEIR